MAKSTTGNLIPSAVNTPLDARTRIATLADAANIENPVLGGIFFCSATGKHYRITGLKAKTIGALTVENAAVDSYEVIPDQADMSDLSDRVSNAETTLSTKAAASDVDALADRVTAAETSLAGKSDLSDLSELSDRVSAAETTLSTKAAASDVASLSDRVSSAESALEGKSEQSDLSDLSTRVTAAENTLSTKAAASDVTTLSGRMTAAEGTLADHTTALSSKAAAADVTNLSTRITAAETSIENKASVSDVNAIAIRLTAAENELSGKSDTADATILEGRISAAETSLAAKAETADLTALTGRVTSVEGTIAEHTTALSSKAAAADVAALSGRMTIAETSLEGKADQSDLSDLSDRVSDAETSLSGKATASDVTTLAGRMTTAENTISNHTTAITGKAAASDVAALANRVSDAETAISGKASASDLSALSGRVSDAENALAGKSDQSDLSDLSDRVSAAETAISGKAPADHTHDFGAYAELTKFEVYATDAVIPAGTVDADTGLAYAVDVPAGMTHALKLRSDTPRTAQDVVIDWGDGSSSNLKNGDYDSINDSEWATVRELIYFVSHTYSTPGKYIVTISGKGYWGFQVNSQVANILSRIFASDLPVASWVVNLASCAANSPKLQSVLIPTGMDFFTHIHNASGIFNGCTNLLSATNFATKFKYTRYVQNMFKNCSHMTTCDFQIPQNCIKKNAYTSVFEGCAALTANIADLLPERGFDGVNLDISRCFYGCAALTGTVPASILWNDMRVVWTHANTFTGCPAAMLAQIPTSWGGTASEVEDPHPITRSQVTPVIASKVDEAMQNLSIPAAGGGTGNILGGYAVKATAYNATTFTLTLDPGEEGAETDMEKFVPGTIAYVNELTDDVEDDPETAAENEEVWGVWKSAEIASVDAANFKITFTEDIGMTTGNALENIVCRVADASRKDAAASSGDRNFVTGDAASADGGFNTVTGTGSKASGAMNNVSGNFSVAAGVSNTVSGNRDFASGGNNKVTGDMDFVTGNGNEIEGQGAVVLGSSNREVTGVDVKILGDGSKASGNRANLIGFYNEVSGDESSVLGNGLKVAAKKAVVIGQRGELADTPENKGAVAIAGGDTNDGTKEISFIHRSRKVNALDETETEPAFSHEYRGRLKAMVLTIAEVGTVELDHDQYARWELTGTGAVTLTLANWQDGDRGEVVIDTTKQTFSIPASWIVPDEVWDAWTETPGKYCMEIRQEGGAVFAHAAVPFNAGSAASGDSNVWTIGENGNWYCNGQDTGKKATGSGSNVILSPTPPAEPYDGLIWCQVESASDSAYLNVAALSVVESASEPASPVNGTIWIETQA